MGSTYGIVFPRLQSYPDQWAWSVFLIPGKSSYLLQSSPPSRLSMAFAISGKYYYSDLMSGAPPSLSAHLAFPVNIVVIALYYSLRLPCISVPPFERLRDPAPEKALDAYLSRYRRFVSTECPQISDAGERTVADHAGTQRHAHTQERLGFGLGF
jgi:hypothetical protein